MEKKTSTKEAPKKEVPTKAVTKPQTTAKEAQPDKSAEAPKPAEVKVESAPTKEAQPEAPKPMTQTDMQTVIEALSKTVVEHTEQISELQEALALARKRKPTQNGRIQVRDKQTGTVYPSKNATYQSLLKAGELKELVDKGVFGSNPEKNNFGWFALQRALPDRFEEVKPDQSEEVKTEQNKEQA